MRRFSSYGPVDKDLHYYVPREELVRRACSELEGRDPEKGGHYVTVWAPRQCGKTWIMNEVLWRLQAEGSFRVLKSSLENLKALKGPGEVLEAFARVIRKGLSLDAPPVERPDELPSLFAREVLHRPLILILDEFDALGEEAIGALAGAFRYVHDMRRQDPRPSAEKEYLLHGLALVGVRSVVGVENVAGSPFNVQRSMRVPNLTRDEVRSMFRWYEEESGQQVEPAVADRVFDETRGQPGLVSWLGELLTEAYPPGPGRGVSAPHFDGVLKRALRALPNNNIINIIAKADREPYRGTVLELFRTSLKTEFAFDDPRLNFLYMNGVIDMEDAGENLYVRFSSPFVQKRLFNHFSRELFGYVGKVHDITAEMDDVFEPGGLNVGNLLRRYQEHLRRNRDWLLKDAPRRKDLRVLEAVHHFALYEYLSQFLAGTGARVWPEFPAGNGAVDLLVRCEGRLYPLELKSFTHERDFPPALKQAARYAASLGEDTVHLAVFVEEVPDEYRKKYETPCRDEESGVLVVPVLVETGP